MKNTLLIFFISFISFGQINDENVSLLTSSEGNPKIEEIQIQLFNEGTDEYENQYKEVYEFDANGNKVRLEIYFWNTEDEEFIPEYKTTYVYDDENRLIKESSYQWNFTVEEFIKYNEVSVVYDEFGRRIELNYNSYYFEEDSEVFTKAILTYDGYFIENYTAYVKSPETANEFIEFERGLTYTQGENNTTTVEIETKEGPDSEWELFYKRIIQFDDNYNTILEEYYEYNNEMYAPASKESYVYDLTNNKLLESYDYATSSDGTQFENSAKYIYTYDGNTTNQMYYYWDSETEDFILSSKFKVVKNDAGQITEKENANWNNIDSEYEPTTRYVYNYENGYVSTVNTFQGIPFGFHSESTYTPIVEDGVLLERTESYQLLTDEPVERYKYIYNFPELDVEKPNNSLTEITLYPNPIKNNFTINNAKNSKIEIYNSLGQKVFDQKIISEIQNFQMNKLDNGLYFAKVIKENNNKTFSILIQK